MWSKTKMGAALVGIGLVIATVGGMISGTINTSAGITALLTEVGVVLAVFGIRDIPLLNGK